MRRRTPEVIQFPRPAPLWVCGSDSMHPDYCDVGCVHCARLTTPEHQPSRCHLCKVGWDIPKRHRWPKKKRQEADRCLDCGVTRKRVRIAGAQIMRCGP